MSRNIYLGLLLALSYATPIFAKVIYDESADGDLSGEGEIVYFSDLLLLDIDPGPNSVIGTTLFGASDGFRFIVEPNETAQIAVEESFIDLSPGQRANWQWELLVGDLEFSVLAYHVSKSDPTNFDPNLPNRFDGSIISPGEYGLWNNIHIAYGADPIDPTLNLRMDYKITINVSSVPLPVAIVPCAVALLYLRRWQRPRSSSNA